MIRDRLLSAGMTAHAADLKSALLQRALGALGRESADVSLYVPGRIEVLGKHTDYAGGRSLLCAVERGICMVANARSDRKVRVTDVVADSSVETLLSADASQSPDTEMPDWAIYVATVARRLALNFAEATRGADIAFGSDLPPAAGMSSSSALMTSIALALIDINNLQQADTYRTNIVTSEDLAEYLGTVENGQDFRGLRGESGVGTFGGSEDHTAMLCCRPGELSLYRFCPVAHEQQIHLPSEYCFVVAVSGVVANKTGAARDLYNRASLAARQVLDVWNSVSGRADRTLAAALASSDDAEFMLRRVLTWEAARQHDYRVLRRFEQFYDESVVIVPQVARLIAHGKVEAIGDLVERSQRGAEHGLENQVPETVFLADSARALGAAAASAFGAGFGGSVWALVDTRVAAAFADEWRTEYIGAFPQRAEGCQFFTSGAGPSAMRLT